MKSLTAGQRSHLRVLYDSCIVVEVLGLTAAGDPVVRRVDHRKEGDPARDVTYSIRPSGAGVDITEIAVPIDDDLIYENFDNDDFTLLLGV